MREPLSVDKLLQAHQYWSLAHPIDKDIPVSENDVRTLAEMMVRIRQPLMGKMSQALMGDDGTYFEAADVLQAFEITTQTANDLDTDQITLIDNRGKLVRMDKIQATSIVNQLNALLDPAEVKVELCIQLLASLAQPEAKIYSTLAVDQAMEMMFGEVIELPPITANVTIDNRESLPDHQIELEFQLDLYLNYKETQLNEAEIIQHMGEQNYHTILQYLQII